jgi:hypothetical protein
VRVDLIDLGGVFLKLLGDGAKEGGPGAAGDGESGDGGEGEVCEGRERQFSYILVWSEQRRSILRGGSVCVPLRLFRRPFPTFLRPYFSTASLNLTTLTPVASPLPFSSHISLLCCLCSTYPLPLLLHPILTPCTLQCSLHAPHAIPDTPCAFPHPAPP